MELVSNFSYIRFMYGQALYKSIYVMQRHDLVARSTVQLPGLNSLQKHTQEERCDIQKHLWRGRSKIRKTQRKKKCLQNKHKKQASEND